MQDTGLIFWGETGKGCCFEVLCKTLPCSAALYVGFSRFGAPFWGVPKIRAIVYYIGVPLFSDTTILSRAVSIMIVWTHSLGLR